MTWKPQKLPAGGYVILKGTEVFPHAVVNGDEADRKLISEILAELLDDHRIYGEDDAGDATIAALLTWLNEDKNCYLVEQSSYGQLAERFMEHLEGKEEKLEAARVAAYVKRGEGDGCWYCDSLDHKTDECPDFRHNLVHPIKEAQGRPANAHC